MKRYQLKVCGNKYVNNFLKIANLNVDYVGFIFYKESKRFVENKMVLSVFPNANKVGVFVNDSAESVIKKAINYHLDVVQLHGDESVETIEKIRHGLPNIEIWKAIGIDSEFDFETLNIYQNKIDAFVFDTKTPDFGGSGQKFDWQLLNQYQLEIPFFLSGGITLDDAEDLKKIEHAQLIGFDINSGFETEPGIKNADLVKQFQEVIQQP